MANDYYTASGAPSTGSQGSSSVIRGEYNLLVAAFDKMPALSGNGDRFVRVNSGGTALESVSAATLKAAIDLEIGTDVQAYDAGLASIAGLTTAADRMIYTTASDTYAVATLTSFARTLLDDSSASTARTTLGLGSMATRNVTISTSSPSGGSNGDLWFVREA